MATSCEELTHWKRLWCWEGLGGRRRRGDRGWDGWMASPTRWTWVWVNSDSWWWTGRPGVLQFMGSQRVGHDWATELNWRDREEYNVVFWVLFWVHSDSLSKDCCLVPSIHLFHHSCIEGLGEQIIFLGVGMVTDIKLSGQIKIWNTLVVYYWAFSIFSPLKKGWSCFVFPIGKINKN